MKKSELKQTIIDSKSNLFCLVGPNASGKTYFLNDLFNSLNNALFFHEDGLVTVSDNRNRIIVHDSFYLYVNDKERGGRIPTGVEQDSINKESLEIVSFAQSVQRQIDTKHLSLGTTKLMHILNGFIEYNLNNIDYILLDEPENCLDDRNLKVMVSLVNKLLNNSKTVIMVSHNPRFLELLRISVNDIYVFTKPFIDDIRNISFGLVLSVFDNVGSELVQLSEKHPISEHYKYEFLPNTPFRKHYVDVVLHSYDFYKTLFYPEIIIVEGLTELYLLKSIQTHLSVSNNYYVSNGKYKIPFLISLFSLLCDNVKCFFDTDFKEDGDVSFSNALTDYIKNKFNNTSKLVFVPTDIESFLGFDMDEVVAGITEKPSMTKTQKKNFKNRYKEYLCLHLVTTRNDARQKIINLFAEDKYDDIFNDYIKAND